MKNLLLVILILSLSACVETKPWTKTELAFGIAAGATTAADWSQTREISLHPDRWLEMNFIMGAHPSLQTVDHYFIVTSLIGLAIAHYGPNVADILPESWRKPWYDNFRLVWLGGWTINEGYWANHNYNNGIRF